MIFITIIPGNISNVRIVINSAVALRIEVMFSLQRDEKSASDNNLKF
jgi:hypothetical protein